jgi:hypothetical protein
MEDKKTLIYASAKELFSEKGFKNTGVSAITKKAGMAVARFTFITRPKISSFWISLWKRNVRLKQRCLASLDFSESRFPSLKK